MDVTVRRGEAGDRAALGRLGAILVKEHYSFDPRRFLAPEASVEKGYGAFLAGLLQQDDAAVFVAETDGEVVGYAYVALEPMSWKELRAPAGFVHDIVVLENARGLGAATRLLEVAVEWLRAQGAPRVILWSASANEAGQRLFRRRGFRPTMVEMTLELEAED